MENMDGIISFLIACIELMMIINLVIFVKKDPLNKIILALIALLFLYQSLETLICFAGLNDQFIIYLAFFTITFLPPLGLHLVWNFTAVKSKLNLIFFIPAVFFVSYYAFTIRQFAVTQCTVLYASYYYPLGVLYGVLYYLPVVLSIYLLINFLRKNSDETKRKLGKILLYGYLFTFVPLIILVIIIPSAIFSVVSILCKLAVVLAVSFAFFALKNNEYLKRSSTHA